MEDAKHSNNTYLVYLSTCFVAHRRINVLHRRLVQNVVHLSGSVGDAWVSPELRLIDV